MERGAAVAFCVTAVPSKMFSASQVTDHKPGDHLDSWNTKAMLNTTRSVGVGCSVTLAMSMAMWNSRTDEMAMI
jgi:hypothetical protein